LKRRGCRLKLGRALNTATGMVARFGEYYNIKLTVAGGKSGKQLQITSMYQAKNDYLDKKYKI
jgi:hypothetical protein